MAERGRETKLTKKVQDTVCEMLRLGMYRCDACAIAGIAYVTMAKWIRLGKKAGKGPHHQFYIAVKKSEAEAIAERVERVRAAGQEGPNKWQADAWWLERRHPEKFGAQSREIQQIKKELAEIRNK